MFLQTWHASQREWPQRHRGMLKAANKYGVTMDAVEPTLEIKNQLPLWHHFAKKDGVRQLNNLPTSKCLRDVHQVLTVGDGMKMLERLNDENHSTGPECWCEECQEDRDAGCIGPHACIRAIDKRLDQIQAKWDPRTHPEVLEEDEEPAAEKDDKEMTFKPPPPRRHHFRRLPGHDEDSGKPTDVPRQSQAQNEGEIVVTVCGAEKTPRRKAKRAGAGLFYGRDDERNENIRIPETWEQSRKTAEVAAALLAVKSAPSSADLLIVSESGYLNKTMGKQLTQWEDQGWTGVRDRAVLQCLAAELRSRSGRTTFREEDAVTTNIRRARELAITGCSRSSSTRIHLQVPEETHLPGAKLVGTKQKVLYQAIRESKNKKRKARAGTDRRIKLIQEHVLHDYDKVVSKEDIWIAARNKDFSRQLRNFMWRSNHDSFYIGNKCRTCGETEDIKHILLDCNEPGQAEIWATAEELWRKDNSSWPITKVGAILGCGLAEFKDDSGRPLRGKQRLFRILVSESAFTIWKLRNERVIPPADGTSHSMEKVLNRWYRALNDRLEIDMVLANRPRKGKLPSLDPLLVLNTWSSIVSSDKVLSENWLKDPRVLVGPVQNHRPPGRNR
ncbi:hypothetical protein C8F01DRAFT_1084034 [Mycena amicta]|nr:hypothetical protein C8F01DRAFT_1084034 [Mycena amicta]